AEAAAAARVPARLNGNGTFTSTLRQPGRPAIVCAQLFRQTEYATMSRYLLAAACSIALAACSGNGQSAAVDAPRADAAPPVEGTPFQVEQVTRFNEPWAMTFLPDGRLLVTEKPGTLRMYDIARDISGEITGVPAVAYGGQGGLGDVVLHPGFDDNHLVYISYAEAGEGDTAGAAVARARLVLDGSGGGALQDLEVIWR